MNVVDCSFANKFASRKKNSPFSCKFEKSAAYRRAYITMS